MSSSTDPVELLERAIGYTRGTLTGITGALPASPCSVCWPQRLSAASHQICVRRLAVKVKAPVRTIAIPRIRIDSEGPPVSGNPVTAGVFGELPPGNGTSVTVNVAVSVVVTPAALLNTAR